MRDAAIIKFRPSLQAGVCIGLHMTT